jgi:protein SCO1
MQAVAGKPGKLALHPGWVAFAALALAVPMGALLFRQSIAPGLPMLGELPAFSLVAEDGKPFRKDDLLGRVWIADFVFTSCSDACPRLQAKMKKIQDRLIPLEQGGNIGLLSISVDPERDTPAKLKQYAEIFGARPGLWRSLTGDQQEVERTVVRGFHTAMARMPRPAPDPVPTNDWRPSGAVQGSDTHAQAFDIMHGERLVLVDRMGRIRGYYEADDHDRLLRDARALTVGGRG